MLSFLKKLTILTAFFVLPFTASASLITTSFDQASYLAGDTAEMDVFINSANPDMSGLNFEIGFNDINFSFINFDFETAVEDPINTIYQDVFDFVNALDFFVEFTPTWEANLTSSFKLGTATFDVFNSSLPETDITLHYVENVLFEPITPQQISAQQVPEPTSIALFAFAFAALYRKSKKHSF